MKKWLVSIICLILVLTAVTIPVSAIADGGNRNNAYNQRQCEYKENFIDEDGDGICDNKKEQCSRGENFIDEDGDGVCDNKKGQCSREKNFIDEDGDGVCDNKNAQNSRGKCYGKAKNKSGN